ncbi:transforming growth factor-beta receptor-associated protein 1 homolog isoform X2 [Halichondria panicea]|uniref:transforming growth factor-beta receptor-associated protein 1 homolog isoform X2 n=1 Tax=Halichondria panicea TaxID=6063 RepID=UPI00312B7148
MPQHRNKTVVQAFNLVPVVEQALSDRPKTEVSCLAAADRCMYIGTQCGLIIYYQVEENKSPLGKIVYQSKVKGRIQLGADKRKPVQQLTVVPHQKRLVAMVDGVLYVMHMSTLELFDTGQRVSRIQCYCVNECRSAQTSQTASSTFELILAPQRKKLIQQYALSGDKMVHLKDYTLPDPAVTMARDGGSVCVAVSPSGQDDGRYVTVNIHENGKIMDLVPYDSGTKPIVKRTNKGEFLVNTGTFGIIVFASGISKRPPVDWSRMPPSAATYKFPYIVAWSELTAQIHVFNILDQRCVQEIPFPGGRFLGDLNGKVYGGMDRSIYVLPYVPLRDQVSNLLDRQLVEEAVLLAETITAVEAAKEKESPEAYMNEVKQRAAFIYLGNGRYSEAEALLVECGADPREVIVLFDDLLPAASTFKSKGNKIHGIPSIQALATVGQLSLVEAKKFLIRYLKDVRTTPLVQGRREDVDTSLVKLLAEERSSSLIPYIENHDLYIAFEETKAILDKYKCHHALGLLYYYSNQASKALNIWTRISDEELTDKDFPGFGYIVDFLSKYTVEEVVFQYSEWALKRDEELATNIFTERTEQLNSDQVLKFLSPFKTATVSYLEHIIHGQGSKEERYHTKLAGYYLDTVLALSEEGSQSSMRLGAARQKLLEFLESSSHYHAPQLLSKVQDSDLHRECALLYGRMDEHEKALTLLAHKLKDYKQAEEYCRLYSQDRSRQYRQNLYQTLLRVYLLPRDKDHSTLIRPALSLLNSHGGHFDGAQVLELLPPHYVS